MEKIKYKFKQQTQNGKKYAMLLIIFSLFTFVALISYNASDVCINVASNYEIINYSGKYGAILADLLLQYFGLVAYFIIFVLFYFGLEFL